MTIQCHEEREKHHCLSQEEGINVAHPFLMKGTEVLTLGAVGVINLYTHA